MAHYTGMFYGYRGIIRAAPAGIRRTWSFAAPPPRLALKPWDIALLPRVPYEYKIFKGHATDNYAANFQEIGMTYGAIRLIFCHVRHNNVKFIFTYDGVTPSREREFDVGFARVEAVVGFKVKNATPGLTAWYQLEFLF